MNLNYYRHMRNRIFVKLLKPLSADIENYRRELIVNVILLNLACIASLTLASSFIHHVTSNVSTVNSLLINLIFVVLTLVSLRLSRRRHYRVAAYSIVALLVFATLQITIAYGLELPIAVLLFALTIVVAGILLSTRAALTITGLLSITVLVIGYAQVTHRLHPNFSWQHEGFQTGDAVGLVAVLSIIGVVSWLANREIDRSLLNVQASELALAEERDNLEIKVVERTRELEETQFLRTIELQRLADFGRLSAHLLHEVANPLTAASLNLEQVTGAQSKLITQAQDNIKQINRYLAAARKQLQQDSTHVHFELQAELDQVISLLKPVARDNHITLSVSQPGELFLFGDPVKFSQLMSNLVANAIDAYEDIHDAASKQITVTVVGEKQQIAIMVKDQARGITSEQLPHIFDTFFTTKSKTNRGLGIGLALVKQYVEHEFGGSISATSTKASGTVFTVHLKQSEAA